MKNRLTFGISVLLSLTMLLTLTGLSEATNFYWVNSSGGSFEVAGNWNPVGGPPQVSDSAYFDIGNGNYNVYFSSDVESGNMYIMNDQVKFDMFGYNYDLDSSVNVGWYGGESGQLDVEDGTVSCTSVYLGFQNTASGRVTLSNYANLNSQYSVNVGFQGEATGYLTIDSGSTMNAGSLKVGGLNDSYGSVYLAGHGSSFNSTGGMIIGSSARGVMYIMDGAVAHCGGSTVGYSDDSYQTIDPYGSMTVSGSGSQWRIDNDLNVGYFDGGNGTVTIDNGGVVQCGNALLGDEARAKGVVSVSGYGSALTSSWLQIGNDGYGSLRISDQGSVNSGGTIIAAGTGTGIATLTGAGSVWNESYTFQVNSSGSLTVSSGATLNISNTLTLATDSELVLDGGTINTGSLDIDDSHIVFPDGTLTVSGGVMNVGSTPEIHVDGAVSTDLPTLRLVDGAKSLVSCPVKVGVTNRGAMEIRGGSVLTSSDSSIGINVDSVGVVTVADPGSLWEPVSLLTVGDHGSGELNVLNGADVWTYDIHLGANSGASAKVTVSGTDASLATDSNIYVGGTNTSAGGTAVLDIETGGTVDADVLRIWNPGTVNLDGGTLSVSELIVDGGTLNFNAGTIRLTGTPLTIGPSGPLGSSVELGSGQHIDTSVHEMGIISGARLCVNNGASIKTTMFSNYGELELNGHTARIQATEIGNSGLVYGNGTLDASLFNGASGQVRVETGDWLIVNGPSDSFNAGTISLAGGTLEFVEKLENTSSGFISGRGTLRVGDSLNNDGVLALSGGFSDVYGDIVNDQTSSKIVVTGGALATFYDDVHSDGEIRVSTGCSAVFLGEFAGAGGITGTGTAYMEGDLRPGNSPAQISFGGNLIFSSSASLEIELAGTGVSEYDSLDVGGLLSLAGTLEVQLIEGFMPTAGDTFDILDWTTLATGSEFSTVILPSLVGNVNWDISEIYIDGTLSVVPFIPGDANNDGMVDGSDVTILANNWQAGVPGGAPTVTWFMGDFNGDGMVDGSDVTILANNWQYGVTSAAAAVPEPSMIVLLLCSIAGLLVFRRR